jgi:hypothetical protein
MMHTPCQKDLVILVADKNMEHALKGLLSRPPALKIREITFDLYVHTNRDGGCLSQGADFLRSFVRLYRHALVIFDQEGCGHENDDSSILERNLENELSLSGWEERAKVVVIHPELEVWVWSDSPHVESVLGWQGRNPDLRTWLRDRSYRLDENGKPLLPKEAMDDALRAVNKAHSSALFNKLAQAVSFERCTDPAFIRLKNILRSWFPASSA